MSTRGPLFHDDMGGQDPWRNHDEYEELDFEATTLNGQERCEGCDQAHDTAELEWCNQAFWCRTCIGGRGIK